MERTDSKKFPISFPTPSRLTWLALAAALFSGGIIYYGIFQYLDNSSKTQQSQPTNNFPTSQTVVALGYLEPAGEVIQVTAPSTGNRAVIKQIQVKEGDQVQAGQVIAVLSTCDSLQATVNTAQTQIKIAQARLAQVKAGAKKGDIQAQVALVTQANAELTNARLEYQRYQELYDQGAVSAQDRDSRLTQLQKAQAQLRQAQQTLSSISKVRPEDVQEAQAQLTNAIAQLNQAKADLDLAYVRAPRSGQIIRINTYPSELVGEQGIVDLGQTNQMFVSAEVYQSDINKVRLGQRAHITGDVFSTLR